MDSDPRIRYATMDDAEAMLKIYAPFVVNTTVSFEIEPPSVEEFAGRISGIIENYPWLVCESEDVIAGYAYATSFRSRAAYRYSVETTVYIDPAFQRRGIARAIYGQLIHDLTERGFHSAYAGIALPNLPSIALHEVLGYEPIGIFPSVGYKFSEWHDVAWYYRPLTNPD